LNFKNKRVLETSYFKDTFIQGEITGTTIFSDKNYLIKRVSVAFSNKPFGHISSIVLAKIATWVLSTQVAIKGKGFFNYLGS